MKGTGFPVPFIFDIGSITGLLPTALMQSFMDIMD